MSKMIWNVFPKPDWERQKYGMKFALQVSGVSTPTTPKLQREGNNPLRHPCFDWKPTKRYLVNLILFKIIIY